MSRMDIIDWLEEWLESAERDWHWDPRDPTKGWYGSGFNNWGVQTNQKYLATAATVAAYTEKDKVRWHANSHALAALRFCVSSHVSGDDHCSDGQQWGHTWISALGIERMMFAVDLLDPLLSGADRMKVDQMLVSECRWIYESLVRGDHARGIVANRWNKSGCNVPESNLWNGALLWRTAQRLPTLPEAEAWSEHAIRLFINSVSVPSDATNDRAVDNLPIRARHVGSNFFESYALDHHGYLNVGYMVICVSNAALLHFDLKRRGNSSPEALHHHQIDLWSVLRNLVGVDGRIIRIGGDTRARYSYCQEWLLPALLYAIDHHHDQLAQPLLFAHLKLARQEQLTNPDRSFYGSRLAELSQTSPYYFTRLESDRACALAFTAAHLEGVVRTGNCAALPSIGVDWVDHEHGAVFTRGPNRFASYSWRANGVSQGLCFPPEHASLAEWELNLSPEIVVEGRPKTPSKLGASVSRRLVDYTVQNFKGGFLTWGRVAEGVDMVIDEGWSGGGPAAVSDIVVAALPDEQTMIGIHVVRTLDNHAGINTAKGLHLCIPNDVTNGATREMESAEWNTRLVAGEGGDHCLGPWANIDERLGIVALTPGQSLELGRSTTRRGGSLRSMFTEEICLDSRKQHQYYPPNTIVLHCTWAVLSGVSASATRRFAEMNASSVKQLTEDVVQVEINGVNGTYLLLSNLGASSASVALSGDWKDISLGVDRRNSVDLPGSSCCLLCRAAGR